MPRRGKPKQIFNSDKHCGAWNKAHTKQCCMEKGAKTMHLGSGRCWLHGGMKKGDGRLKHGLQSKAIKNAPGLYDAALKGEFAESLRIVRAANKDVLDLTPEAELVRVLVHRFVTDQASINDALKVWYMSFGPAVQTIVSSNDPAMIAEAIGQMKESIKRRPDDAKLLNPTSLAHLAEKFAGLAEKIHKIRSSGTITLDQFVDSMQTYEKFLGMVLLKHLKDDNETLKAILADIEQIDIPQTDVWSRIGGKSS